MQNKTEVAEALFKSIDIIIDRKLEKLGFDRTVVARITGETDSNGAYQVEYQNSRFYAHSIGGMQYDKDEMVYVVIPSNNMRRLKFIFGKIGLEAPTAASYNIFSLQREINALKEQQHTLMIALEFALNGQTDDAKNELYKLGGNE